MINLLMINLVTFFFVVCKPFGKFAHDDGRIWYGLKFGVGNKISCRI